MGNNPTIKIFKGIKGDIVIKKNNRLRPIINLNAEVYENLLRISNDTGIPLNTFLDLSIKKPCINCGCTHFSIPSTINLSNLMKNLSPLKTFEK